MPIQILMPALSPTMEEGTLATWMVKEGDAVSPGDVIAEIETDKATMEVEAVDEGTMGKILVPEGTENVAVNTPIAVLLEEGEDASAVESVKAQPVNEVKAKTEAPAPAPAKPEAQKAPAAVAVADKGRTFASPLARRIAEQKGIDLSALTGSGPRGRIVKRDVESAAPGLKAPAAASAPPPSAPDFAAYDPSRYEAVKADGMRKTVARRLTESKRDVPHYYLTMDCEIDALLAARKDVNAKSPVDGVEFKASVNDFVIMAVAKALKAVPGVNASWAGDSILYHAHADISVAVALDGGLITPVIRNAETKGLAAIANEMKDLGSRARDRKLKPEEYQGGTFSVSNLGMFGIKHFTAVINPPEGAILAVGAGEERPVVKGGHLAVATVMTVTLSCDHRVIDGALGAQFLQAFKGHIENPVTMLV